VQRDDRRNQLTRGLAQIDRYLARLDLDFGWLVIFDRRRRKRSYRRANLAFIEDRVHAEIHQSPEGRSIEVIRA
jgi:hypothetical protein